MWILRYSSRGSSSFTYHNNICLMFFSDYSEFLDPDQDIAGFGGPVKSMGRSDAQYLAELTARHDLAYSEFTSIISKRLVAQPYPFSFQNTNPFCPLCLRLVSRSSAFTTCYINDERNYLIHQECLAREHGYELRNVGEIVKSEISVQEGKMQQIVKMDQKGEMRQFYIEIALTHPINDKNFIKLSKKVSLSHDHFWIAFDQEETDSYFPNIVLLPMTDYHLTLTCSEVGSKNNQVKMTKYLTFKQMKDKRAVLACQQIQMDVEPINSMGQKRRLGQLMNYKCRYDNDGASFIRIHAFKIALSEELIQSEEQCLMLGSGSTIVEELLNEKQGSISTIRTSEPSPVKYSRLLTDSNSSNEAQIEKINLGRLIATNTLIDFVKSSSHSRQFQSFLEQCSENQLLQIITNLREKLVELITHEYGNYMMQKLFAVCKPLQRLELLQLVIPSLCEVARNKQGTHTIQAFLDCFTLNEEYSLVSMQIAQDFYSLSCHSNATHFIQKIVKTFPLEYTIAYFHYITAHLMTFALDKNGMCVVKHMMRRLRELEGKQAVYDQAIDLVRRQLIFNVTFNVDQLIVDSYGNYVIQFCYELFDLDKCSGITERILSHFPHYALSKYSASVLLKCISIYWTDRRIFLSLRGMSNSQILELFRSKDGNRILLELMEKQEGSELWERIYSVLVQKEPTKYYHDRWGVCLGCRSGQVGTRLTSFPEARKKTYNRKY